jgi:L-histidine Nalpha-methyltransferase
MSTTTSSTTTSIDSTFAEDVKHGLTATPKRLNSRWLYDARGSELFQEIMRMDAYYPTDCEYEIFDQQKEEIFELIQQQPGPFHLIEFGAGDGFKTKLLLRHFLAQQATFDYLPIDISGDILRVLEADLAESLPDLKVDIQVDEYFAALHKLNAHDSTRKVLLFLGSNIGNFTRPEALRFLQHMNEEMRPGDQVIVGFDLKKDPNVILTAYNDPDGITREFNLNLLDRMNRELGATFEREHFQHYPYYDPLSGETKSYLISRREQAIHFEALDWTVHFQAWEPIWIELSQKYDFEMIEDFANHSGFQVLQNFIDSRRYYVDSAWELK